jgi:hypothetical protein
MKFVQKNLLLSLAAFVILLGGGAYLWSQNNSTSTQPTSTTTSSEEKKTLITVKINDGVEEKSYSLTEGVGQSALEVTQSATDGQVETNGEGANAYVTSISGRAASSDNKEYWELLVNGQSSQVGAGSYTVKEGDSIEWKISTY